MKPVRIEDGIVPLNEFKARAGRLLAKLRDNGEPLVITLNGRPAGVVVSPEAYDRMVARDAMDAELALAEADVAAGRTMSTTELRSRLKEARSRRDA